MNKNLILKTDILDIIFEKRNKAYGAYNLRKFYPNRLKLALGFMLIIATVFSAFTLLPKNQQEVITKPFVFTETKFTDVVDEPKEAVKKTETEKPDLKNSIPADQKKLNTNILIVDKSVKTEIINTILPTDVIGTENIDNADNDIDRLVFGP